jgi:predicted ester cyclase
MTDVIDTAHREQVLFRYIDLVLNKHRDDLLGEFVDTEFEHRTDESALGLENDGNDFEGIKLGMQEMRDKLDPVYQAEVLRWDGDTVHLGWTFRGVHRGTVMGLEPTNRPFTIKYTGWARFRGDKIITAMADFDPADVMDQVRPQLYGPFEDA